MVRFCYMSINPSVGCTKLLPACYFSVAMLLRYFRRILSCFIELSLWCVSLGESLLADKQKGLFQFQMTIKNKVQQTILPSVTFAAVESFGS